MSVNPGVYTHYKDPTKRYLVLGASTNQTHQTDNDNADVVYLALYEPADGKKLHRRTVEDFLSEVEVDGKKVKRFQRIERNDELSGLQMYYSKLLLDVGVAMSKEASKAVINEVADFLGEFAKALRS